MLGKPHILSLFLNSFNKFNKNVHSCKILYEFLPVTLQNVGLNASKLDVVVWEQQRRQPAYTSAQSDQCLCYSLDRLYYNSTCFMPCFYIRASLCSRADCFESYLVGNPENMFSLDEAHIMDLPQVIIWASSREILSLGFPNRSYPNPPAQLRRLPRMLKFRL